MQALGYRVTVRWEMVASLVKFGVAAVILIGLLPFVIGYFALQLEFVDPQIGAYGDDPIQRTWVTGLLSLFTLGILSIPLLLILDIIVEVEEVDQ